MKKVGIMTLYGLFNLGNRLQNYAMQTVLRKYSDEVYTFVNLGTPKPNMVKNLYVKIRWFILNHLLKRFILRKRYFLGYKRHANFKKFNKLICLGETIYQNFDYRKLDSYDLLVAGSDQIWNPEFDLDLYNNTLAFATDERKLAVAPSIAIQKISSEDEKKFKEYLADFSNLSVREQHGAQLLEKIMKRKVECLIDPTLMLSQEEWMKVAKKPKFHDESKRFILLYFLGNITNEYRDTINKVAEVHQLEIINLYDKKSKYFSCGPSEFIYLISKCDIMFTDSFHGSVFSFIFDRPFKVFSRIDGLSSMFSRMESLINIFGLKDIVFSSDMDITKILNVDYSSSKEKLLIEQEKFSAFVNRKFNN